MDGEVRPSRVGRKSKLALWALLGILIVGAMALLLDPLGSFNALMPKDRASARVAQGLAYGTGERLRLDVYAPSAAAAGPFRSSSSSTAARGTAAAARAMPSPPERWRRGASSSSSPITGWCPRCAIPISFAIVPKRCAGREAIPAMGRDGGRIVLIGHSAGAYNAAMLALDPSLLGRDRNAIRGFAGLAGPADFLPLDDDSTIEAFGAWPRPAETQPISHAGPGSPPALLLHGADDTRVKPRNSHRLAARLRSAGGDVRLKLYPGLGHIGILTALAVPFRRQAPVLADLAIFAHEVTEE